ncbi:hypothetical protein BC936DRAFT_141477 [Jimgerdemannia flammicorona]|uniref:Uncharacterized protein n=1 Tax=Jimgerdemannia flammicorona TaxID=994334 RepID=A0A433A245_9FUNG|nr:hypothetical protein BC936DRAFT_141477 [Jimgerdemannia flammicorona]
MPRSKILVSLRPPPAFPTTKPPSNNILTFRPSHHRYQTHPSSPLDGTAASLRGKRRSDSSFETGRPTKRPATQIDRSFSSDTGVTAAERRPLAAKPIRPVNRIVGNAEKEKEKGVPKDWREVRKEKEEKELEKKVARIVEKQMKEMSEKGKILSPLLKKHQTEVQSRLESLEQKLDVKTDSEIALMLTPETKTKTALAHARLGKKAEKQAQYQGALEHYEKALLFMPDNSRLQVKMQEVKDLMNGVSKPKRRREKENQQRSPANDDNHGGEHDLGNTTLISNTSTSIMTASAGFLEDSQHSPFVASTSASPVVLTAPVAVPLTEEQIEQIAAELVRIVNTGVVKRIKGIRGVGAKRAAQIVDFVKERGAITEVGELVDAGLSIAVVNGLVRSNRGLIEVA